jgi:adenylate kinase family enzyme
MQRVLVVGASGSGKSTLARAAAASLRVPYVELDALYHGPGWVPRAAFTSDVEAATRGDAWVVDGNYAAVRELLWSRADAVVWLDLPRGLVEWQVVRRSLVRWLTGAELWNGNREPSPLAWRDPEHPVRWSWTKHGQYQTRYAARFADPAWAHLRRVRLRSRDEVRHFLAAADELGHAATFGGRRGQPQCSGRQA